MAGSSLAVIFDRVIELSLRVDVRLERKRPRSRDVAMCREWDGPAALPPPAALRVRGSFSRAGALPCLV